MAHRPFALSPQFIYLGSLDASGDRCNIRALQNIVRGGFPVYGIDLNPQCWSPPLRVFVEANHEAEALEIVLEHAENDPTGKIGRNIMAECDGPGCWCDPDARIDYRGKLYHQIEDAFVGVDNVTVADAVATCPGGRFERAVKRYDKYARLDRRVDNNGGYEVWGEDVPTGQNPNTWNIKVKAYPATHLEGWRGAYEAWVNAYNELKKEGRI